MRWWLWDNCEMNVRWLWDDWEMTVRWLWDDSEITIRWIMKYCCMIAQKAKCEWVWVNSQDNEPPSGLKIQTLKLNNFLNYFHTLFIWGDIDVAEISGFGQVSPGFKCVYTPFQSRQQCGRHRLMSKGGINMRVKLLIAEYESPCLFQATVRASYI